MRKISAAVQEREEPKESQDKISIDPKEIPKASKYSFHDNRFSSDKKVFHAKKMGKKELKMDQKWEHDKFVSSKKKPLKVNIIRKENNNHNITISITKNPSPTQVVSPSSSTPTSQSSQNQPLTPKTATSDKSMPQDLAPKEKEQVVQIQPAQQQEKKEEPKTFVDLPPKPKSFKNSKSSTDKDRSFKKNFQEKRAISIPDPVQMVPQMMMPQMYQEPNYIYSPYMTNSGQVLYMTENGLFVPSPVAYFPTYMPNVSKAIPIMKPSDE